MHERGNAEYTRIHGISFRMFLVVGKMAIVPSFYTRELYACLFAAHPWTGDLESRRGGASRSLLSCVSLTSLHTFSSV